ncbi:RNA-binding protein rnp24 [Symbiodinium microadriaticum]|uniref:RNA-binding protein rnp24 n=2 Tax=Symbiodinium TaxID=2949 RepID=A0A1Q9EX24_SYMMI|nr:RNA-binding protein rnp24 [Symbiodinium microadriaticum]
MRKVLPLLLAFLTHADETGLLQDDECQEGSQGECAMNALQLRSSQGEGEELFDASNDSEMQSIASELNQTGRVWRLYHVTSPSIGPKILREGFRAGHAGWCGGAIYFGNTAQETHHKAVGTESHQGYMIEAMVDVGRVKSMPWNCYTSVRCIQTHPSVVVWQQQQQQQQQQQEEEEEEEEEEVHSEGFQTIVFNPGDGPEIVIWDKHQVKSMRQATTWRPTRSESKNVAHLAQEELAAMDDVDIYGDLLPPQPKAPAKAVSSSVPDPRLADPASEPPAQSPAPAVAAVAEAVAEPKPKEFATLQKELQAEEASACPAEPGSPVSEGAADLDPAMEDGGVISDGTEGSEDGEIHLGEVRASETGTAAPHFRRAQEKGDSAPSSGGMGPKGPRIKKKEILLFIGPPPPLPPLGQPGESSSLLIGGLPWWLTDTELRRYGEQYGQVRRLRILDFAGSGKSAGVALLEFAQVDATRQALRPDVGLCRPQLWRTLGAAPRAAAVGGELRGRLREGTVPWLDGGPCSEDLRAMLLRQCGMSAPAPRRSPPRHSRPRPPPRAPAKRAPEESPASWAEKLKKLKSNVNSRLDSK